MKLPWLPVLLLPVLSLSLVARGSAQTQTAMLVDAPNPSTESSSLQPGDPSSSAAMGVYPVQVPQPEKPRLHVLDWSMLGAAATLRALDYASTEKAMSEPQYFHEGVLPQKLVNNKAAFATFQAATVGINYAGYKLLVDHHMRPLARISQYMYVGVMTFQVAHNYQLLGQVPAK